MLWYHADKMKMHTTKINYKKHQSFEITARLITKSTEHWRKINFASFAREGPVFFQRSRCVVSSVSQIPGGFFKIMKNHGCSPRMGPKKRLWAKPFERTVLGSYFMKNYDILPKWILKTYYMWEKYLQIM